jgi:hypothetical protein
MHGKKYVQLFCALLLTFYITLRSTYGVGLGRAAREVRLSVPKVSGSNPNPTVAVN